MEAFSRAPYSGGAALPDGETRLGNIAQNRRISKYVLFMVKRRNRFSRAGTRSGRHLPAVSIKLAAWTYSARYSRSAVTLPAVVCDSRLYALCILQPLLPRRTGQQPGQCGMRATMNDQPPDDYHPCAQFSRWSSRRSQPLKRSGGLR